MTSQRQLDYDPPVELVQRIGPTPEQIRKAAKPQTVRVLRMLQEGPKTTADFLAAYIGRFGGRIKELRDVGHVIERRDLSDSSSLYTLVDSSSLPRDEDSAPCQPSVSNPCEGDDA